MAGGHFIHNKVVKVLFPLTQIPLVLWPCVKMLSYSVNEGCYHPQMAPLKAQGILGKEEISGYVFEERPHCGARGASLPRERAENHSPTWLRLERFMFYHVPKDNIFCCFKPLGLKTHMLQNTGLNS